MKLKERLQNGPPLLLDGAIGTELDKHNPTEADYPGRHAGFNDGLTQTHPEWVKDVHCSYIEAGADIITTNTFGSNRIKLDEYGMGDQTVDFNYNAASVARAAADKKGSGIYVLGSIGLSGHLPSVMTSTEGKDVSLDELEDAFYEQARGLHRGGVDGIILETGSDILESKTMISAVRRCSVNLPIIACITFIQPGKMMTGTPIEAAYFTLAGMSIDAFGINCSTGPAEMADAIAWLDENATIPLCIHPNAGIPDMAVNDGQYPLGAAEMSDVMYKLLGKHGGIKIAGGCCGTTPEYTRQMRTVIDMLDQVTESHPITD